MAQFVAQAHADGGRGEETRPLWKERSIKERSVGWEKRKRNDVIRDSCVQLWLTPTLGWGWHPDQPSQVNIACLSQLRCEIGRVVPAKGFPLRLSLLLPDPKERHAGINERSRRPTRWQHRLPGRAVILPYHGHGEYRISTRTRNHPSVRKLGREKGRTS
jgi:hypothetical protein